MSSYYDDEAPRRHKSHRQSRRPVYEEEEVIESRTSRPTRQMDLVRRTRDDSSSSVEEVRRDFAPGEGAYVKRRTVVRDKYPAPRARSVEYDDYDNYSQGPRSATGGGRRSRRREEKSSRRSRYDSDSGSDSPPPRNRRKSFSEQALAALGLGGAAAAATSGNRDRARSRGRGGDYSRSPSPTGDRNKKIQQAVKAAVTAGAVEAFRSRKEPGGWQGQGKRVLTAAIGAAGINGAIDKDPNHHSTRHTIEAALGGLAGNRLINGARSRSRSRGRHGDKESGVGAGDIAATAGLAALGVKAFNDYRNKSQDRSRRYSSDSDGSRSPGPRRKRSNSVSAFITRGLDKGKAALGIEPDKRDDSIRRDSRQSRGGYDDRVSRRGGDDQYYARPRGGGGDDDEKSEKPKHDTSTDYSSEEEIKKQKKMHAKELITAGLATVATIHAAHSVYQTREKREKRKKQVEEGKMSPEEAKKLEKKGLLQDAASVGIAALGIKGAYSEWKEMKEQREEFHNACHELEEKRQRRREKQMRAQSGGSGGTQGSYRNSEPNLNQRYQDAYGPRYYDGNPYSAGLPPPPMGAPPMRY